MGLQASHRDLARIKREESRNIIGPLERLLSKAQQNLTRRSKSADLLPRSDIIAAVKRSLRSVDIEGTYELLAKEVPNDHWLLTDSLFQTWRGDLATQTTRLLIHAPPGFGKTEATVAAVRDVKSMATDAWMGISHRAPALLAYFLCQSQPGWNNAEQVLKSLLFQLIDQEPTLFHSAQRFLAQSLYRDPSNQSELSSGQTSTSDVKATLNVTNLWQSLEEMLRTVSSRQICIIIGNIHLLEQDHSTTTLLEMIKTRVMSANSSQVHHPGFPESVRWLFSTDKDPEIARYFAGAADINLEGLEYGAHISRERKTHALVRLNELRRDKQYNDVLAYHIRSTLFKTAPSAKHIDILCLLLQGLPLTASQGDVKQYLQGCATLRLDELIEQAWRAVSPL